MCCRIVELRNKDVVCKSDGNRIGSVYDVEIDTCSGKALALVILGKPRFFGLFGREDDIIVPWDMIDVIGDDVILISNNFQGRLPYSKNKMFIRS